MSSVHCVVVWEWQCNGQWLPHTPGVTRTLERAHAKKLTRVVLADADPALRGHYVNLRTLTQCMDNPDGSHASCAAGGAGGAGAECGVRRACYSVTSPAARGLRWDWARLVSPPLGGELHYEPLPMEVQCLLEEAWAGGGEAVTFDGWVASVSRMTARGGGGLALLRRGPHPPYPLTRPSAAQHPPPPPERAPLEGRRPRIPQQHTGSSVHSVQSIQSFQSVQSVQSVQSTKSCQAAQSNATMPRQGARSASPRDRKPGLARQILHNLNIFSNNNKQASNQGVESKLKEELADEQRHTDTECSSTRSGRRHSVDTVSTYLSHESKESLQQASVGELLNCSGGSDDVFEAPPPPSLPPLNNDIPTSDGSIVGVDEASSQVCVWVRAAPCPQWGALCPACLAPLHASAAPAVALAACQHLLHLHCLNRQLERLRQNGESLYIECLVCGRVYGRPGPAAAPGGAGPPPGLQPRGAGPPPGLQPRGSMAWALQPVALPQHPHCTSSILVTYNFQSGRQGPQHPSPGAPYYAVGFPRHSLLPDTQLGRQVLSALRAAWERGVLFRVCASLTTGREHVLAWSVAPPPAQPAHYAPPAQPARLLRDTLARLARLLPACCPPPTTCAPDCTLTPRP
ncbi:protein deltex [Trichoplusia ni]|uniref:E3 ubiquitin-protein ligase n=1 Tax=Trichoplusia ni TaxID=7111 RepID=A0A7E5WEW9_TRINI|nr:protein deltex [Trichoplusia ni]